MSSLRKEGHTDSTSHWHSWRAPGECGIRKEKMKLQVWNISICLQFYLQTRKSMSWWYCSMRFYAFMQILKYSETIQQTKSVLKFAKHWRKLLDISINLRLLLFPSVCPLQSQTNRTKKASTAKTQKYLWVSTGIEPSIFKFLLGLDMIWECAEKKRNYNSVIIIILDIRWDNFGVILISNWQLTRWCSWSSCQYIRKQIQ